MFLFSFIVQYIQYHGACEYFALFYFSVLSIWPWCLCQITEHHPARPDLILIHCDVKLTGSHLLISIIWGGSNTLRGDLRLILCDFSVIYYLYISMLWNAWVPPVVFTHFSVIMNILYMNTADAFFIDYLYIFLLQIGCFLMKFLCQHDNLSVFINVDYPLFRVKCIWGWIVYVRALFMWCKCVCLYLVFFKGSVVQF